MPDDGQRDVIPVKLAKTREQLRQLVLRLAATENDVAHTMKVLAGRGGPRARRRAQLARLAAAESDRLTERALRWSEQPPTQVAGSPNGRQPTGRVELGRGPDAGR